MKIRRMITLLACMVLLTLGRAKAEELVLKIPDTLHPFEEASIIVLAPESGTLAVLIKNAFGEELPIADRQTVSQGTVTLAYESTSYGGMPLKAGAYQISAELSGKSGARYAAHVQATVGKPITTLEYALPRHPYFYQRQSSVWFVDCSVTGACSVNLEIYSDENMSKRIASIRKKLTNSGKFRISWKGVTGSRTAAPGIYWCKAYASGRAQRAITFPVEIREGRAPKMELTLTGSLLPEHEQDVWEYMMKPLVVVDIPATDHQRLYEKPSGKSKPVGSVHGQSQGLEVVEVGKSYTLVRAWRHEDGEYVEGYVPTKKLKTVQPNSHYGLLIDKNAQTMTVYENGTIIGQLLVTTGLMDKEKLFRETRSGAFMTTDRVTAFESNGYWYDYPIRIDGGNLIHQLGYVRKDGMPDFRDHLGELGKKASEGCVRLDYRTDETHPINAYWLWTHLEYGTKVLVTDDALERALRLQELE